MIQIIAQDLKVAARAGGNLLTGILFFLAIVTVVPFAVGPDLVLLAKIGPAVLWVGALLASLLGLERMFQPDREDGTLDILLMQPISPMMLIFAKASAHWIANGLPLIVAAPLFGLMLNMSFDAIGATVLTLLAGTPAITFIGCVGAAVTVSLPRGGLLLAIIVLPVTIPVLIFGTSAAYGAVEDPAPFTAPFLILCALTLFFSVLGPAAAAWFLQSTDE